MSKGMKIAGLSMVAVVAVVVALFGATQAFAQSPTPRPVPPVGAQDGPLTVYQDQFQAALADALGISADALQQAQDNGQTLFDIAAAHNLTQADVQAAMQAAHEAVINQALADGAITQAQADAMLAHTPGMGGPGGPGGWFGPGRGDPAVHDAALADTLGLTVEQFQAERDAGKTLAQIAEEQGVSLDDVQAAMQTAREAEIQQMVADGTITQAQADAMLANTPGIGGPGDGLCDGVPDPRGGGFPGGRGNAPAQPGS